MSETPDPDEKFSLYPLEGEEVLKRLLEGEGAEDVPDVPEDEEELDS